MGSFDAEQRRYLAEAPGLARIATVGTDGTPHVVPSGWSYDEELDALDLGGHNLERTKKFRHVATTGCAAVVIDDVLPPWQPRGVEIRGRAEAIGGPSPAIRLHPDRVVSWGLGDATRSRPTDRQTAQRIVTAGATQPPVRPATSTRMEAR